MKKIIRLTESDLTRIVKKIITESSLINENLKFLNGETAPEDLQKIENPKYEIPGTFRILSVFSSFLSDKLAKLVDELKKNQKGSQIWKKYVQKLVYFENRLYNAVSDLKKNPKRYGLGSNEKYKSATNWPQLVKKYNGEYIEKTIDEIEEVINMMINEYRKSNNQ